MKVRLATDGDLDGIMAIEEETFGDVGDGAMASREVMLSRIERCNVKGAGWFWVVEYDTSVVGYLLLQPTDLDPRDCVSWESSTDNGTLANTYNEYGKTIFGVSLAVGAAAPPAASSMLYHKAQILWLQRGKERIIFCSRIPTLREAMEERGVVPEEYCFHTDEAGRPVDWLLREFHDVFGVFPQKFLANGFLPDVRSAGHGALIVVEEPFTALERSLARTHNAGITFGSSLPFSGSE